MDDLANLQPETVELPDLKDYRPVHRFDNSHNEKENTGAANSNLTLAG